ncbi:arginine--tRNA ligase [Streptomyces caniscabiei]|uniref:arginine--tRNA ligase n=1 Tax=Streptomyces caniscabiei TaxID=2746961 RepID=UPI0029A680AB|nr:arginine--tRNA ligase [Streptomyces caniscabiei]MDX2776345.1 arginine--tRNA ligase [Streptomyces caniscabiei]
MEAQITKTIKELFNVDADVVLTRPDPQFGDFATNVALQLAKPLGESPREIAEAIVGKLRESGDFSEVSVAGPGFINIRLADSALLTALQRTSEKTLAGQTIVTEYSDPNPFKVLHAGHLYTTLVGDVISRLLEAAGATVHRVNFGGDVGLHVAKNMWAIVRNLGGELPEGLSMVGEDPHERAAWLSARYVEGNAAYEEDEQSKAEIIEVNKRVYQVHADGDHDSGFARIYWTCREWSYDYFKVLYDELNVVPFEKYYPESATTPTGIETVTEQLANGVYEKSNGAIVFNGEKYGLHTRVFINSQGLPTYEAKDVGLIMQKWRDYHFDRSVVITGNDIVEYMKVVQKSIEQFEPELTKRSVHLTHGNLKLVGGKKMSSRKGNVLLALDVIEAARTATRELMGNDNSTTVLGAIKYAFLKQRIGGDIIYNPKESVSLEGNSGPYLQYAHARACGILRKSTAQSAILETMNLELTERPLAQKLGEYVEVVGRAQKELLPHYICTYLYELAQEFNRFYEKNQVVGSDREAQRVALVSQYAKTLRDGLDILGIHAPERM